MVAHGHCGSRLEAVELGRKLEALGWVQHVGNCDAFQVCAILLLSPTGMRGRGVVIPLLFAFLFIF